jgi:type I restriction enzyme, R subunit
MRYNLFGFTGTPIFSVNARSGGNAKLRTTAQAFGCFLHGDPTKCPAKEHQMAAHAYTIVDAISDKNVLPFRVDYVNTIKLPEGLDDKQVSAIDTERALLAPERLGQVAAYTLEHFDQKTKRAQHYSLAGKRVHGFNALLATASIDAAKRYYAEFKAQQKDRTPDQRLKIGIIYSYATNEDVGDDYLDEEGFETSSLDQSSRDFLDDAIKDYNATFGTSFDTSTDKFQNYYKDLSLRIKNREIDLVIVVNMFLTGFDATTLNTLFVDKRLVNHGLLQAYSRTLSALPPRACGQQCLCPTGGAGIRARDLVNSCRRVRRLTPKSGRDRTGKRSPGSRGGCNTQGTWEGVDDDPVLEQAGRGAGATVLGGAAGR